jgi:hypothetical protein
MLQGKKTYLIAVCMIIYAIFGMYSGYMNQQSGIELILQALGISALRNGVENK